VNEKSAIRAIASTINANAAAFVAGLTQNGKARELDTAHRTVLGSITKYYTCKVHSRDVRLRFMEGVSNLNHGTAPRITYYDIEIYVADYAVPEQDEEDSFIVAHENFRVLVSRMADYFLKDAEIFEDAAVQAFIMEPNNRIVDVENLNPVESSEAYPILGSIIRFTIIGCND